MACLTELLFLYMEMDENSGNIKAESICQDAQQVSRCVNSSLRITKAQPTVEKPLLLAKKNETCFGHFSGSAICCPRLKALQMHLLISTELKLTQECLKRYTCALKFSKKLESYVELEYSRLDIMYSQDMLKSRRLNLSYYHKICKEAKVHLIHWQHLEYKIDRQPLPTRHIVKLRMRIQKFKRSFLCLRRKILHWLHMIAIVGLRVLANASFKHLQSTVELQNFLQGIEEFNHMISAEIKFGSDSRNLYSFNNQDKCAALNKTLPTLDLVEILSTICTERSILLAKLAHENFVQEAKAVELHDFLSIKRFSYKSGGHLSTQDLLVCTANVRYGKLQIVIKKCGDKEEEFIKQLMGTASVCAFFYHENEVKRQSDEFGLNPLYGCECSPAQVHCLACQLKRNSINTLMDVSDHRHSPESSSSQDNHGSNQDLRALFMESKPTKAKNQMFAIYRDELWSRFGLDFYNALGSLQWLYAMDASIGPVCCWSTAVIIGITQQLDNLASTGPFSEVGIRSVQQVSHSLYLRSVLSSLDSLHCLMIAVGQQDKCKSTVIVEGVLSTKSTSLMNEACLIFQHFIMTVVYWDKCTPLPTNLQCLSSQVVRIEDVLDRFGIFLDYCIFWFTTKVKQFLTSWSLQKFFALSQHEMCVLMKSINTTLQLMEQMHCQLISDHALALKHHWDEMERKAGYLQIIEVESWEKFKSKFITVASDFWKEMMPKRPLWKRSRNSGSLPSEPSSYVERAIIHILQPVIEGVTELPQAFQNSILIQAVEIMMDTWSSYILKEQIKFSVIGAYQLQVDFNYVKLWLTSETSNLSSSVQSDLACLDVFRHLNEAVRLLMIQPKKKRNGIVVNENGLDSEVESNLSTLSGSSMLSSTSSYDGEPDLLANQTIPNKDQWLNLRLRKGKAKRTLAMPNCLRPSEQV